jgi:hypothetical protein
LGKPTVATVPPNFTARLATFGTQQKGRGTCLPRTDEGAESAANEAHAKAILPEPSCVKKQFPISHAHEE